MRREFRRSQDDDDLDTKKILYITGAIFVVAIILLAIVFWVYSANWEEDYQEIGQINSITEDYEETSIFNDIGNSRIVWEQAGRIDRTENIGRISLPRRLRNRRVCTTCRRV